MDCTNCGLQMDFIKNKSVWLCAMGCGSVPVADAEQHLKLSLSLFLSRFFQPDEAFYIGHFSPKELTEELKERPGHIPATINNLVADVRLQKRLKHLNETQGIYFAVNSGGTKKTDITRINAAFCEIDDLPIMAQHDLFDNAPLPPSIRIETKKSVHAYWLLEDLTSVENFLALQRGLLIHFGSDKSLVKENQLMRLPFFNHVSFDAGEYLYKKINIHTFSETVFTSAELSLEYPDSASEVIHEPTVTAKEYNSRDDDWQKLFAEMGDKFRSLPGYHVEHGGRLASAQGVCHHGETNRTLVMNLKTGVIFCRSECGFDDILRGLGLDRPPKKQPRFRLPRVSAPVQFSRLFQTVTGGNL